MHNVLVPIFLGVLISVIGICNMKGNISSIHWYHRRRVTEEDLIPFGKLVGLGTVIIGISIIILGIFTFIAVLIKADYLVIVGSIIVIIGIVIGLALSFYAMFKYNKGIF